MHDLGPSPEDLERFGDQRQHGWCPHCGAEVWDDAEFCPDCGDQIGGRTASKPPVNRELQQRWVMIVCMLVLLCFLALIF